ncbi:arylamine N-acetyltransferase family protein [Kribbella sp. CA-294648]|uniref:arylamine N-acetyltransferase family protein n=1 Tax=Kribbella sp. CA-294648 TaxID=3239948 RepID=UPI003D90E7E8
MDTTAFLRHIGVAEHPHPSLEGLCAVHEAFVGAVPYESVQFQFGGGGPLNPETVAARIMASEAGGYCFQLNGVLAHLLTELGYQVTKHRGGVQTKTQPAQVDSRHLVLTVRLGSEDWIADAGLGDGLVRPLRAEVGAKADQVPFELTLRRSDVVDGWRLDYDPRSSLLGMDFEDAPATLADFEEQHRFLSLAPDSPFVRVASAFLRRVDNLAVIRSVGFTQTYADRVDDRIIESQREYFDVLADVFLLPLPQLSGADRDALWRRVWTQYEDFLAAQEAAATT